MNLFNGIGSLFTTFVAFLGMVGGKILLALIVFFLGRYFIKKFSAIFQKTKLMASMDPTIGGFMKNAVEILLYVVLTISIISILGVPIASVITILASAGVAVGLSLQGALSNLAGGIMLLIFRPFNVGDYVAVAGGEGTVQSITLVYTVLTTVDNKRITIPNGSLMNANVTNFSSEETRRVDLIFNLQFGSDVNQVNALLIKVMSENPHILKNPEVFAGLTATTEHAMQFTARAWVKSADYWDVYFEMMESITDALHKNGFKEPQIRVLRES